jgi:ABC-type uncharacterized transport system substrate-binding protein
VGVSGKQWLLITAPLIAVLVLLVVLCACQRSPPTDPTSNNGEPWRIGYYEGGGYADYAGGLRGLAHGLAELGWIEPIELCTGANDSDSAALWHYLATHVESSFIQFEADAYWSAHWDEQQRAVNRSQAISVLQRHELDLVIAMGTWAGEDLAVDDHHVPVLVFRANDPVRAGIVVSVEDSGLDHVLAEQDPDRFLRQARLFHDVVGFRRLGVAYEDTVEGRIYANLAELRQATAECDFELIECQLSKSAQGEAEMAVATRACYAQLAPSVDAVWVGSGIGEQPKFMPGILSPLMEAGLPTWSSMGTEAVRRGVLASISLPSDYSELGHWYAVTIAQVLNGVQPRDLNPVFAAPLNIAINMETAQRIRYDPPKGFLEAADVIFQDIEDE